MTDLCILNNFNDNLDTNLSIQMFYQGNYFLKNINFCKKLLQNYHNSNTHYFKNQNNSNIRNCIKGMYEY